MASVNLKFVKPYRARKVGHIEAFTAGQANNIILRGFAVEVKKKRATSTKPKSRKSGSADSGAADSAASESTPTDKYTGSGDIV